MGDRDVIKAFVRHLAANGQSGLRVDRWPEGEIRTSNEIDTIAGDFAIEHTSLDTVPNQSEASDWFMRAAGQLEREFEQEGWRPPFRLNITRAYDGILKGQRWTAIKEARQWINPDAARLPDGLSTGVRVPGIPFSSNVRMARDRPAGVFFARCEPPGGSLPSRIRGHLDDKASTLARYQAGGKTTILLAESDEIALMNDEKIRGASRDAYPAGVVAGADQFW